MSTKESVISIAILGFCFMLMGYVIAILKVRNRLIDETRCQIMQIKDQNDNPHKAIVCLKD